jgi:copper transport protein
VTRDQVTQCYKPSGTGAEFGAPASERGRRAPWPLRTKQVTQCYKPSGAALGALAGLAAVATLALPAAAWAHASLESASPSFRQRLETAPRAVVLRFDQAVKALPNSIVVYSASGKVLSGTATNGSDGHVVRVPLRSLSRGAYTIRWHALSGDGHVVSGVYTFGVRFAAPPPTEAYGASGPTRSEHVVRWLYFLALSLLVGGLAFRLLVLRGPVPPALERRFYAVAGLGLVGVLEVGIVAFLLRAEDALQLPFGRLLYGDLSPIAGGTRFGTAFIAMTLGYAAVGALVFLGWLTGRRAFLWTAFVLAAGFASGLSLSGHSAVDAGSSWLSQTADWVHLTAASLWVGGLIQLAFVVWPTAPELRRPAFFAFARLAPVLIAVLVGAGVYLSILRLPELSDLWSAGYGRVLLVKLALVGLALAWGGAHHFLVRPRLVAGGGGRVRTSLLGEGAVAMSVLLAAAVLVDSRPPPQPTKAPVQAASVRR